METLSALLFVMGVHQPPVDSTHIWPVMWSFDIDFIVIGTCSSTSNHAAGNLRRCEAHA